MRFKIFPSFIVICFLAAFCILRCNEVLSEGIGREENAQSTPSSTSLSWKSPVDEQEGESVATRLVQGLGFSLGLFFIGCYCLKRWGGNHLNRHERKLKIVERLSLSPKHSLILVECGGRSILCGLSPNGVSLVKEIEPSFDSTLMNQSHEVPQIDEEEGQEMIVSSCRS